MLEYLPYIICGLLLLFSIKDSIQGSLEEESAVYF